MIDPHRADRDRAGCSDACDRQAILTTLLVFRMLQVRASEVLMGVLLALLATWQLPMLPHASAAAPIDMASAPHIRAEGSGRLGMRSADPYSRSDDNVAERRVPPHGGIRGPGILAVTSMEDSQPEDTASASGTVGSGFDSVANGAGVRQGNTSEVNIQLRV